MNDNNPTRAIFNENLIIYYYISTFVEFHLISPLSAKHYNLHPNSFPRKSFPPNTHILRQFPFTPGWKGDGEVGGQVPSCLAHTHPVKG